MYMYPEGACAEACLEDGYTAGLCLVCMKDGEKTERKNLGEDRNRRKKEIQKKKERRANPGDEEEKKKKNERVFAGITSGHVWSVIR